MWNSLFFQYVTPLIRQGAKKSLEAGDMPPLPHRLSPRAASIDENKIDWSTGPQLIKTLLWEAKKQWLVAYIYIVLCALSGLLSPILVYQFVHEIEKGAQDFPLTLAYGIGIGLTGLLNGILIQHYFFRVLGVYQMLTNTLNRKLFRHSLRLRKTERDQTPVGDIVNHMSSDSDSLANLGSIIGDMIYNAVLITGFVALLFYYLGHAAWAGLIVMILLLPITKKTGSLLADYDERLKKKRDARVTLMSQVLSSIRVVKYFAWEKSISEEVRALRNEELRLRGGMAQAEMRSTIVFVAVGTLVLFVVLGAHVLLGGRMDAALVFVSITLFRMIEDPFWMFSRIISTIANAKVSAVRISHFINLPERNEMQVSRVTTSEDAGDIHIRVQNLNLSFATKQVLRDLSFEIRRGENVAIIGGVGAGKTSLLMALLGEVESKGDIFVAPCPTAYVPQEAYIINSTIRENLSFGRTGISETEWNEALYSSCFEEDLIFMQSGLDTEIGERGVNLSGGQKQRLSLARSLLQKPGIILLDDPLSAVDTRTERQLIERLILGQWKDCTRVTVTHRLEHLDVFDRVLFLVDGELKASGRAEDLRRENLEFRAFTQSHEEPTREAASSELETKDIGSGSAVGAPSVAAVVAPGLALVERTTEDEDRARGAVEGGVYLQYLKSLAGNRPKLRPLIWSLMLGLLIVSTTVPLLQKAWLAWASNFQSLQTIPWGLGWAAQTLGSPLGSVIVYGLIGLLTLIGIVGTDLYWLKRGLQAGRDLHDEMLEGILHAQIRFFDSTPVGRILQRFSRDVESIDVELQWSFETSAKSLIQVVVNLFLIIALLPLILVFLVPVFWIYYRVQKMYRASAREVKRLDSVSRSPRYAHFKETLQGLVVLRSLKREEWFFEEFTRRLELNQQMFYGHYLVNRWFSSRIPVVGAVVAMLTTTLICFAVARGAMSAGIAGLLTVSSLGFWVMLNWGIRVWAEVESRMTSVERIRSFAALPAEGRHESELEMNPSFETSSVLGQVEFRHVKLRYAAHLPLVLNDLSFEIAAGQRVGLIGRTGSGKTTVFQALYRFAELEEGQILIDGVDIKTLKLSELRKVLAIIPQDPTLFIGTLRSNLDRFNRFAESEIWSVLERVRLAEFVRSLPLGLASEVVENGANLSQGQRQLMCLARALLIRARILILDEATASVDVRTDDFVQSVIRDASQGMTMIVIAHRLGTVKDCDLILELAHGRLKRRLVPSVPGVRKADEEKTGDRHPRL